MNWLDPAEREEAQKGSGFTGDAQQLRDLLRRVEDLGADEFHLVPASGSPEEVSRAADAVAPLF